MAETLQGCETCGLLGVAGDGDNRVDIWCHHLGGEILKEKGCRWWQPKALPLQTQVIVVGKNGKY